MKRKGNYSITEIEDLIPWERDAYMQILMADIKQELDQQQRAMGR
jgi:hypothetical protein